MSKQEKQNQAHQIFQENEHFLLPDTPTYACVPGCKK